MMQVIAQIIAWIGLACWAVCFVWMHRISARQESLLRELREVTRRIEHFSKVEHDLIREVHPQVSEIKESVEEVSEAVSKQNANGAIRSAE
jgi:hypothetical protein